MRRVGVILNGQSGPGSVSGEELRRMFREAGLEADVRCPSKGESVDQIAAGMVDSGHEVVVAAGGDGTVSGVASVLAGSGVAMGVLPLGTFNHLAKDLRIPLSLREAVGVIATGAAAAIDVGEVNGRLFLNNISLGVYPAFVEARGQARRGAKLWRWCKRAWGMLRVLAKLPRLWVRVMVDGREFSRITPAVLIGNNEYRVDSPGAGTRPTLRGGRLSLILTRRRGPRGLIMQALRASLGRLRGSHDLDEHYGREISVWTRPHSIHVGVDGEVVRMKSPLHCRVRAGALRVIVSEGG